LQPLLLQQRLLLQQQGRPPSQLPLHWQQLAQQVHSGSRSRKLHAVAQLAAAAC
jgi:ABC-type cobalamin transport system ATPase subunit